MSGRSCGKARYATRAKALGALTVIRRRNDREKAPSSPYPCPRCKGWHLTSAPK